MFAFSPLLQLILISLLGHLALAGTRITTLLYALSLQASEFALGALMAVFALLPMLLGVLAGRMVDRIGVLRPMRLGCLAIGIGCVLPSVFNGLPVLYLAAVLVGTGFMVLQVCSQHWVGAMSEPGRRAANFSWLGMGYSVSGFTGPVAAGLLIDYASFRLAYLVFSGSALLALLLLLHHPIHAPAVEDRVAHAPRGGIMDLLRSRKLRRIYLVGTLLSAAWDLFIFVLPIHATRLGFSASTIGLILGCFSTATFTIRFAMPWLSRRYSEWQLLAVALVLAAICYALFPLMQRPGTITLVAVLLGLAVGCSQPNMLALLHRAAPEGRSGEVVGLRVTIGNACQVFLPLAFGAAGAALGLSAVFWGMGALIAVGVPNAWRYTAKEIGEKHE